MTDDERTIREILIEMLESKEADVRYPTNRACERLERLIIGARRDARAECNAEIENKVASIAREIQAKAREDAEKLIGRLNDLQMRFSNLWETQDEARERIDNQAATIRGLSLENSDLRETIARLTAERNAKRPLSHLRPSPSDEEARMQIRRELNYLAILEQVQRDTEAKAERDLEDASRKASDQADKIAELFWATGDTQFRNAGQEIRRDDPQVIIESMQTYVTMPEGQKETSDEFPLPAIPPQHKTCPLCGFEAKVINRAAGNYQIACARHTDEWAREIMSCYVTTGSFDTEEEAWAVWDRREGK